MEKLNRNGPKNWFHYESFLVYYYLLNGSLKNAILQ